MLLADRIQWWEPYGSSCRSALADLRAAGLVDFKLYFRAIVLGWLIILSIAGLMKWQIPGIVIPWFQLAIGPPLVGFVLPLFAFGSVCLLPRRVVVTREFVDLNHGDSATRIDRERIRSIELEVESSEEPRLVVSYVTRRGREVTRTIEVRRTVDLEALRALVGVLQPMPQV